MEYQEIGKIIRSQGVNGDLIVKLETQINSDIQLLYVELNLKKDVNTKNEYKIAYNVEKFIKLDKNTILVKFREVSERSQTAYLEGKSLFIKTESSNKEVEINLKNLKILGYTIVNDKEKKQIGEIVDIRKIKNKYIEKTLMIIKSGDHTLPVPCEENVIKFIDHDKKIVYIKLPDELLEVFITNQ